jgi:multiple sugar transport system substrate-binding protein
VLALLMLGVLVLAACGNDASDDRDTLHWLTVPDRTPAFALADACGEEAGVTIEVDTLPADIDEQRVELVRRFAAHDDSVDILSLSTSLTAELAAAGYLRSVPADVAGSFGDDVVAKAVEAATYDGTQVAMPWWLEPQLLWFRGAAAERAGIDTTQPVVWDDLLAGAERVGATIQIDDPDGSALGDWVNALVSGAGGTLVKGAGRDPRVGLDSDAGRTAAGIVQYVGEAGLGDGPSLDAPERFTRRDGGFMIAGSGVVTDPRLSTVVSDMQSVPYPVVGTESVAPLSGVELAVPADAPDPEAAFDAIECLTSAEAQLTMMLGSGHASVRPATLASREVQAAFPNAAVVQAAIASGVTAPATPYWQRVRAGLRDTWLPVTSVSPTSTPKDSQRVVKDLVSGGLR